MKDIKPTAAALGVVVLGTLIGAYLVNNDVPLIGNTIRRIVN